MATSKDTLLKMGLIASREMYYTYFAISSLVSTKHLGPMCNVAYYF